MNTKNTHNQKETPSIGMLLRNAREQLGFSQQTVAERLCLKVSIIRDIEEDRVPTDLAVAFLRGYIRSYAKLVHIPEENLLPMIIGVQKTPIIISKFSPMRSFLSIKRRKKYDNWLADFILLMLFVIIFFTIVWWWKNNNAKKQEIIITTNHPAIKMNTTRKNVLLNFNDFLLINNQKDSANAQSFVSTTDTILQEIQSIKPTRTLQTKKENIKSNFIS